MTISHNDIDVELRDSLALTEAALDKFPKMFKLKGEKEAFPYKYYTIDRLKNGGIGNIREALMFIKPQLRSDFVPNINKVEGCRIDKEHFDMKKYAEFYCMQDVRLLRDGFLTFRKNFLKEFKIDVLDVVTAASLAFKVLEENVFAKNPKIKCYSGKVQDFIRQAVYGGRCTTAYNKAWDVFCDNCDFDA